MFPTYREINKRESLKAESIQLFTMKHGYIRSIFMEQDKTVKNDMRLLKLFSSSKAFTFECINWLPSYDFKRLLVFAS